jgi:omega-6 fatty acid desaturase (delta-12 desaturase)
MYSLFHDLTHNSLFTSRRENSRWGHLLGYFLFTPYRWWQRQHAIHHAHSGNLEHRGVGEINTMTVEEYENASRLKRLGYRLYRNPLLMLGIGPTLG